MEPSAPAPIEAHPIDATLQVRTPERVRLSLPVAGVGTRALAWGIDAALLFLVWVSLFFVVTLTDFDTLGAFEALSGLGRTLLLIGAFAAQWMYWTLCEVFWGGRTPGKALMRIRVARLDGSAPGPLDSAVRNLLRVVDFLPFGYGVGLLSALFSDQHRRLGDLAAGTLLLREEQISLDHYRDAPEQAPVVAASPALEGPLGPLLASYLSRLEDLTPEAREALAQTFLEKLGGPLDATQRGALQADPRALQRWLRSLSASAPVAGRPQS